MNHSTYAIATRNVAELVKVSVGSGDASVSVMARERAAPDTIG